MIKNLKLAGSLRDAVIVYNKTLLASWVGAYMLRSELMAARYHGSVDAIAFHAVAHVQGTTLHNYYDFDASKHNDPVDLYVVGVDALVPDLEAFMNNESINSLVFFPAYVRKGEDRFHKVALSREKGTLRDGVAVEVVVPENTFNLPAAVGDWLASKGMGTLNSTKTLVEAYTAFQDHRSSGDVKANEKSALADLFFRTSSINAVASYKETTRNGPKLHDLDYTERKDSFNTIMDHTARNVVAGFDKWVEGGIGLLDTASETLQANILLSSMSEGGVVLAPDVKHDGAVLAMLLRTKYPECRAIIMHYRLPRGEYSYHLLRGNIRTSGFNTILSNVSPSGVADVVMNSPMSPERVLRVATSALNELRRPKVW